MQRTRPIWLLETRDFIGIILVLAMVGLMFALVLRPISVPDTPVTNMLIGGFMTVGFSAVIQFYFGSSKGSVAKDDTINSIATAQVSAEPATPVPAPPAPPRPVPAQPSVLGAKA